MVRLPNGMDTRIGSRENNEVHRNRRSGAEHDREKPERPTRRMVISRRLSGADRDLSYVLPAAESVVLQSTSWGDYERSTGSWLLGGALAGAACGDDGDADDEHQGGA